MFEQKQSSIAILYLRVSTDEQDTANQRTGCADWCRLNQYEVLSEIQEHASTSTHWRDRQIAVALKSAQPGQVIVCAEISRLARSTLEVLEIAAQAAAKGVRIFAVKSNLWINDGIEGKIMTTVLALAAEIEKEFIRRRTKEALHRARENGTKLGRPAGPSGKNILDGREAEIGKYLKKKLAKSSMARLMDVSRNTLERKLQAMQSTHADILTRELF